MRSMILAAGMAFVGAVAANAATITATNLGDGQDAYDQVDVNAGVDLASGLSFDASVAIDNINSVQRSPYDFSGAAGVLGFEKLEYFIVGKPGQSTQSPATLAIAGGATILKLLWGSIDGYNGLEFYDGATLLGTITNSDIAPTSSEGGGVGASYVSISSDMMFDSVVFTSSSNAFEFANVSAAVPLPAGVLLMLTGIGGLGVAARRRKA